MEIIDKNPLDPNIAIEFNGDFFSNQNGASIPNGAYIPDHFVFQGCIIRYEDKTCQLQYKLC